MQSVCFQAKQKFPLLSGFHWKLNRLFFCLMLMLRVLKYGVLITAETLKLFLGWSGKPAEKEGRWRETPPHTQIKNDLFNSLRSFITYNCHWAPRASKQERVRRRKRYGGKTEERRNHKLFFMSTADGWFYSVFWSNERQTSSVTCIHIESPQMFCSYCDQTYYSVKAVWEFTLSENLVAHVIL